MTYDPNQDYYDLLGVPPDATEDDIREAYRRRAKEFHPDQNPTHRDWAEKQFKQLIEAYNVLSDPAQRRAYDRTRWQAQVESQRQARGQSTPPPGSSPPRYGPTVTTTSPDWLPRAAIWVWGLFLFFVFALLVMGLIPGAGNWWV